MMEPVPKIQFCVVLANRKGELAKLAAVMANAKVNIEALSVSDGIHAAMIKLVVANPDAAREAFSAAKLSFTEQPICAVPLPNEPGALARLCAWLAEQGHSIDYVYGSIPMNIPGKACTCTPVLMLSVADLKATETVELAALWPGP